jgi:1-aminocyclopropane-1-carboxylate deaminase/D-cysteine desulfhydrase-like pyridoxal-dependent ACC family enzyme
MDNHSASPTLAEKLASIPRCQFGHYPTPLELLPALSLQLDRPVYIKRDDQLGPGLGGNKTRKLEYLLADALHQEYRKVVTFGGLQSNHARLTAAAARRCGLEPHLFYFEKRPPRLEGNLLVNQVYGAKMHFLPLGGSGGMTLEATSRIVHLVALALVGRHYFIPVGGHTPLGCLGYAAAALELDQQARAAGIPSAWVITAAGTGGTLSGLMAGLKLTGSALRLLGIDVGKLWKGFPASIASMASQVCGRLGSSHQFSPSETPLIEAAYVGDGYGLLTEGCLRSIHQLACQEGILLDPIYTAKAFAGMIDLTGQGYFGRQEPLIFLHTGGSPALFCDRFSEALVQRPAVRVKA